MKHPAALAWLMVAVCLAAARGQAQDAQRGQFEIFFTERSPLSAKKDLLTRLARKDPGSDYDLSGQLFVVYVPKDYVSSVPHGVIVWLNYKDTDATPTPLHPILDRSHTIFVVSKSSGQEDWIRAGLALDAIHNLKKIYTIDEARTYLFAITQPEQTIGQKMGLACADAFAGFVYIFNQRYFRPIPIPGNPGMTYAVSFSRPGSVLFNQARTRRHILIGDPKVADTTRLIFKSYQQDGFKQAHYVEATIDDMHYPNLTAGWFEKTMELLDAPTEAPAPASAPVPATRPSLSEAQRMLNLSKSYISAGNYPGARSRLQELVNRFPDDPAAKEARQLLEQIKGK